MSKDFNPSASFLNHSIFSNFSFWTVLASIIIPFITDSVQIDLKFILPCIILGTIITNLNFRSAIKKIQFLEWDFTERKKKERFIKNYIILNIFFSILTSFSVFFLFIYTWNESNSFSSFTDFDWLSFVMYLIPILVFSINCAFTIKIHYEDTFKDDLTMSYKIQKKPTDWIEDGTEAENEPDVLERIKKDYEI